MPSMEKAISKPKVTYFLEECDQDGESDELEDDKELRNSDGVDSD